MKNLVRNRIDKLYTADTLGQPMTPGYWKSKKLTYIPITRLRMTAGGGMGGSCWFEYAKRINLEDLTDGERIVIETYDGEKKLINLNNVAKAELFTIATGVYHSDNPNFEKGDYTYNLLVEDGHKITLSNNGYTDI